MILTKSFLNDYVANGVSLKLRKVKDIKSFINKTNALLIDYTIYNDKKLGSAVIITDELNNTITIVSDSFRICPGYISQNMFEGQRFSTLDLRDLDVSAVVSLGSLFEMCEINKLLIGRWDTRNIKNVSRMFYGSSIDNTLDLRELNLENCELASSMFKYASIHDIKLPKFNSNRLKDISGMFDGTYIDNSISLSSILNTELSKECKTASLFGTPVTYLYTGSSGNPLIADNPSIRLSDNEIYIPMDWTKDPKNILDNDSVITNNIKIKRVILGNLKCTSKVSFCARSKFVDTLVIKDSDIEDNTGFTELESHENLKCSNGQYTKITMFNAIKFEHCNFYCSIRSMNIAKYIEIIDCKLKMTDNSRFLWSGQIKPYFIIEEFNGYKGKEAEEYYNKIMAGKKVTVTKIDNLKLRLSEELLYKYI